MLNYTKRLVKLVKIEIGRNRTRKNSRGQSYSAPIDATGSLRDSIGFELSGSGENKYSFLIKGNRYGLNIEEGKGSRPPVEKIISWIKSKPVRLRDVKGKFITMSDANIRKAAFPIARSIKRRTPVNFIQEAIDVSMDQLDGESLSFVMNKDVANNLEEILLRAGYRKEGNNFVI